MGTKLDGKLDRLLFVCTAVLPALDVCTKGRQPPDG